MQVVCNLCNRIEKANGGHNVNDYFCAEVFMSKSKKKTIRKLTDEQYNEYIATLKNNAALYSADGSMFVPEEWDKPEKDDKQGD